MTVVYGYFFKLQGYQPADSKPNARPLVAPMIIGRVAPVAGAAAKQTPTNKRTGSFGTCVVLV